MKKSEENKESEVEEALEELEAYLIECKQNALHYLQTCHATDAAEAIVEYINSPHCSIRGGQMILKELTPDGETKKLLNEIDRMRKQNVECIKKL